VSGKRLVYVTHQSLHNHVGGASSVTAWVLQALSDHYDVRLATPDQDVDFSSLDYLYGTSLAEGTVGVHQLTVPGWLKKTPSRTLKSLRLAAAFRDPSLHEPSAALIFNTANEMGFPGTSVNYVHCPLRHPKMVAELFAGPERTLRKVNNRAFRLVSGFDEDRFRAAPCIANSEWTARALHRTWGITAQVIYPPITAPRVARTRFADRSDGYVCIGRLSEEKRIHEAIAVIDQLRDRGHRVHLHVVGSGAGQYAERIKHAAQSRPYVQLHTQLSRPELTELLNKHKFGIHMMRNEHFGMAVAEMVAEGMLVFAHRSAGPMEILGDKCPTLFADTTEAIETATCILASPLLQDEAVGQLIERDIGKRFSPQTFMSMVCRTVERTLN
jgi:glycosyltransferase involved in cell wall biosynthesis